ncbi:MAG: pseudaminic acid biosynthesis-associated methylase [Roseburia sp.]|nr:pseudaminic acid biosynthesis-associated methylase [Roseburia sp.]
MYKTEQENFWKGEFGTEYIKRNREEVFLSSGIAFWSSALSKTNGIHSCLELGSNIGLNLKAIKRLSPAMRFGAVEINDSAVQIMQNDPDLDVKIYHDSILEAKIEETYDLTFTSGVLIHINPNELNNVYKKLYDYSLKYILIAEYYNPTPVEVSYRGHAQRLFKRDFAGEFMDLYPDCTLEDYGFIYHRDNNFPMDDLTWFLMRKQ